MSEVGLKTVHVFPSEESYNQNASEVQESDIALTPIDLVPVDVVQSVNGVSPDDTGNVNVPTYDHPNSGVSAGTYNTVTVDEKGHVTSGENKQLGLSEVDVKRIVLDTFFPVGSTYISTDANFNPNTQFGGNWSKIENRFLLGSGSRGVGTLGGEENVTLSWGQMPSHSHARGDMNIWGNTNTWLGTTFFSPNDFNPDGAFAANGKNDGGDAGNGQYANIQLFFEGWRAWSGRTESQGNNEPHNNMPPFEVVNIWKRTL